MIGTLIGIIIVLIILGVLWWAFQQLIGLVPLGEPFGTIVRVLMVVVGVLIVLWVIVQLLTMAGIHVNTFRLSDLYGLALVAMS